MKKPVCAAIAATMAAAGFAYAEDAAYDLGSIVVEGAPISQYRVDRVSSSTFFGAVSEELPVVVDVLTGDFIREQGAGDLHDLLFSQPGISGGSKSMMDRTSGQYTIRGKSGSTPMLDGTLAATPAMGMFLDPNALERIEIARGPVGATQGGETSALGPYGAGGSINMILKQPKFGEDFTDLSLMFSGGGGGREQRISADLNRGMSDSLGFRLPISMELSRPFWLPSGHDWKQSVFLAPSFLWEMDERLRFGLSTSFQYTDAPGYQGVPSFRGKPLAPFTWDSYVAGDNDVRDEYYGYSAQAFAEWDASDIWQLRAGMGYAGSQLEFTHIAASQYASQGGVPKVMRYDVNWADNNTDIYNAYGRATARYDALGARHTTVLHADIMRRETDGVQASPGAGGLIDSPERFVQPRGGVRTTTGLDRSGLLVQDFAEIGMFRMLGGLRYDIHESNLGNSGDALSPRVGITFLPVKWLALFANASRTESPNFGYLKGEGEELTSSWQADQHEVGFRVSPAETLWLSVALYRIEQDGTPSYDDATGYYTTEGRTENHGVEVSISGNIVKNWSIYAGYAFNEQDPEHGERRFDSMPPHSATLQTMYKCSGGGVLDEVAFGLGYRYKHGYDGTMRGAYVGPDYYFDDVHVFDASVSVPLSKFGGAQGWTVDFGVKNIFDSDYFESNRHYYQCFTGEPRTFEVAVRGRF